MKTIAINEPTHKELKKLSEQAKMSMGDYMKEVALYFKRTGINPSTSDEQSPHKAIKVLDKRIEQVISFIKTMEQERLNPLLESLMRLTRDIGKTKLATAEGQEKIKDGTTNGINKLLTNLNTKYTEEKTASDAHYKKLDDERIKKDEDMTKLLTKLIASVEQLDKKVDEKLAKKGLF